MRRLLVLGAALTALFAFTGIVGAQSMSSPGFAFFFGDCELEEQNGNEVNTQIFGGGLGCRGFGIFFGDHDEQTLTQAIQDAAWDQLEEDVVVTKLYAFQVGSPFVQPIRSSGAECPDPGIIEVEDNESTEQLGFFGGLWIAWFSVEPCADVPILGGEAEIVEDGVFMPSTATTGSSISFPVPEGMTFGDLFELSTNFTLEADDLCSGGAPRFAVGLDYPVDADNNDNLVAYIGVDGGQPGVPACVPGTTQNSGNVLGTGRTVDTAQLGGTFYDPIANAYTNYGSYEVLYILLVMDAGWQPADGEQAAVFHDVTINGTTYGFGENP